MTALSNLNVLDKARRAYRRARAKDPTLPPLIAGAGKVEALGPALYAVLPVLGGEAVVYAAVPVTEWRFRRTTPSKRMRLNGAGNGAATPTPDVRLKHAIDNVLTEVADIERRARTVRPRIQFAAE